MKGVKKKGTIAIIKAFGKAGIQKAKHDLKKHTKALEKEVDKSAPTADGPTTAAIFSMVKTVAPALAPVAAPAVPPSSSKAVSEEEEGERDKEKREEEEETEPTEKEAVAMGETEVENVQQEVGQNILGHSSILFRQGFQVGKKEAREEARKNGQVSEKVAEKVFGQHADKRFMEGFLAGKAEQLAKSQT